MLLQPMSSPMMKMMFGCCCAWACKEVGLRSAAIDTIAVALINRAQLNLLLAVFPGAGIRSILST